MKVFWMLVVVLLVAAGVVAAIAGHSRDVDTSKHPATMDAAPAPTHAPPTAENHQATPTAVSPNASAEAIAPKTKNANSVDLAPTSKPSPAPTIDSVLGTKPEAKPGPTPVVESKPEPKATTPPANDGEVVIVPENPKFPDAKLMKAKVVRKSDGSLLIDDRFRVTGSGTEKDPYKLPWEMMISTKDSYNPQLGLARMPQRVVMFDGKYVKITGFTAFPLSAQSPKEMLVMLNQWDGCCIGVPPTAYDAIEVRLAKPGTPEDKLNTHGSVTGVFQVDPYESNGWLMGLYLMNDAHAEYDE